MKKIMNFVLMAVLAVCFVLPAAGKAEAAKLAVVPLANHVEDNTTASMIYMEEIMDTFKFPEFDMIAEDVVDKAVGSRNISDFSKANLERIAVKAVRISLLPCRLINWMTNLCSPVANLL